MISLSVIILAKTNSDLVFETTMNCINSLIQSENFNDNLEIIIVESNKEYLLKYKYPDKTKLILPDEEFGFHKFLNIGVKASKGKYVALCNNDLIFEKKWFSEIINVAKKNKEILSFSPIDPRFELDKYHFFKEGYKVTQHIKGWCLVCDKRLFTKYKKLDENFKFYYSDNDYALSLLYYNIKHVVVAKSHVKHLHRINSTEAENRKDDFFNEKVIKRKLPKQLYSDDLKWILSNERVLFDYLTYYNKWGNTDSVYRIAKYAQKLNRIKLNVLVKILFQIKRKFKL